jgi:hypothetical protein
MAQPEPDRVDMAGPEDMTPDAEPDAEPEPDLPPPDMGTACEPEGDACGPDYRCVDQVCTLWPQGRVYAEVNYVLLQPSALTNVISVIKGLFNQTGFFMTDMREADGDQIVVYYGGADRVEHNDDAPDLYAWQLPERLPTFRVHRLEDPEAPQQGHTWQSDVFLYELVALFGDGEPRQGLGFEAADTVVTMTFNEELTQITSGSIQGYLTREEAEDRTLGIAEDCLLSRALCPSFDCDTDEPILTVANLLDCNEVELDSDIDPAIEGNDAYRADIFFQSDEVILVEE